MSVIKSNNFDLVISVNLVQIPQVHSF